MIRLTPCLVVGLLLLGACADEPHQPIATDGATATGSLQISATPIQILAPSDSDGVPLFGSIADATRLTSGIVAVVDRRIDAVTLIDPKGQLVSQVGRNGEGPGEFRSLGGIGQCAPDTLFVWDRMNDRMNILGPDGAFVNSYRPPGDLVGRYCAGATRFLVWTRFLNFGTPTAESPPIRGIAVLVSAWGDSVGGLGDIQAGEVWPLGAVTQFAVTEAGVYLGTADTAVVSLYDTTGQRLRSIAVGDAHRAASEVDYDAAITSLTSTVPGTAEEVASMKQFMRKRFPMPTFLPAYRAIFTNGRGGLFVVTSPLGADATTIRVFDGAGASLGDILIPGDLEIFEIGSDYLLGMTQDAEGEQQLVVYSLKVD